MKIALDAGQEDALEELVTESLRHTEVYCLLPEVGPPQSVVLAAFQMMSLGALEGMPLAQLSSRVH